MNEQKDTFLASLDIQSARKRLYKILKAGRIILSEKPGKYADWK